LLVCASSNRAASLSSLVRLAFSGVDRGLLRRRPPERRC
jgi:hypothetical protein